MRQHTEIRKRHGNELKHCHPHSQKLSGAETVSTLNMTIRM